MPGPLAGKVQTRGAHVILQRTASVHNSRLARATRRNGGRYLSYMAAVASFQLKWAGRYQYPASCPGVGVWAL
jgi:hypothetical protein